MSNRSMAGISQLLRQLVDALEQEVPEQPPQLKIDLRPLGSDWSDLSPQKPGEVRIDLRHPGWQDTTLRARRGIAP